MNGILSSTRDKLGHEITPVPMPFSRPGQTKRGCEFLGLRILENIRRDWLTLAPDRLNRHDAISSKIARTELALAHCHARARGLRRRRDLQRDLHA